ncbi:segregation/condensation protein A [Tuberibacillus sp. Marseille-P3662]|uniref:segregation/condensation protein A n=1 Tax=Tuberibacillus sp. Marseille-P3662 TaxID=1965358 RepID=UPI000A1C9694|nr:segregation/condensation protein A [Tuberibacillus sp. Marseille-P3662]
MSLCYNTVSFSRCDKLEYKVKINAFEGPLDLLLHLIKKLEIDIYDIPVATITEQYLEYIHQMQELHLDVASEYLVMAATLVELKSRMLLPQQEELEEEALEDEYAVEEEDPRAELMRRLLDYKRYKKVAEALQDKEVSQSHVYVKPPSDLSEFQHDTDMKPQVTNVSLYDMISSLQHLFRRRKLEAPLQTKVEKQDLPIGTRMKEVIRTLSILQEPQPFAVLFPYPSRSHMVVTFLSLLELMKEGQITCTQKNNFSDIMVQLTEGEDVAYE